MDIFKDENLEKKKVEERKHVDNMFESYRGSGLALMTTVIGLSSGGFVGLFQGETTRSVSFLYLIPIGIALTQQLTYYLGCKERAHSEDRRYAYKHYTFESDDEGLSTSIDSQIKSIYSHFYLHMSDIFCWLALVAMGLVTIFPMVIFGALWVRYVIGTTMIACLGYWAFRQYKTTKRISEIEW